MSKSCRVGHDLFAPGDADAPKIVQEGGLGLCRKCNRGEIELEEPCVSLRWVTPDADKEIAYLARVSNPKATPDTPSAKLIGYLLRNHHWSPFEMASMCVEINTTRDITNQIIRHRSFSFQEFSTRYADVEVLENWKECRFQDDANRQNSFSLSDILGSTEEGKERSAAIVKWWDSKVDEMSTHAARIYSEARQLGIAKETARAVLPFGLLPSKIYMSGTIRSWLHYISERTKPGVQKEHREVAEACAGLLSQHLSQTWDAFTAEG